MHVENPNVISVFLNKERKLHTTHSWNFLGLERKGVFPPHSLWSKTEGEDVIIANIDSGNFFVLLHFEIANIINQKLFF